MKRIAALLSFAAAALAAAPASSQPYPNKPVRIIVPYVAGQGVDLTMRLMTDKLAKEMGQQFVIENKPGAAGNLGTAVARQAAADGYTLVACTNATLAANKYLYKDPGFDVDTDFVPVALTGMLPMAVTVRGSSRFDTLQDLVAAARAKPATINVALPHTTARVVFELLRSEARAPLFGIPYRGLPIADIASDQIQVLVDTVAAVRPHIQSGKLKAVAVTTAGPSQLLPGVGSVAQQGVPGFEIVAWSGLCAPKGTPPEAIAALARATQNVMRMPETQERMLQMGTEPRTMGPDEFREFVKAESGKWGGIIRSAQITAN